MILIMRDDGPMTQILVADFLRYRFCCRFPYQTSCYSFARFVPHASQQIGPPTLLALLCCFFGVLFACDSELN